MVRLELLEEHVSEKKCSNTGHQVCPCLAVDRDLAGSPGEGCRKGSERVSRLCSRGSILPLKIRPVFRNVCVLGHLQASLPTCALPEETKGQGKKESHSLKKSPLVPIVVACSFLPGKCMGRCVPACMIINNKLILVHTLRDFCSGTCDLSTTESSCLFAHSYSLTLDPDVW